MNPIIFFANFNNLEGWVQARDSRQGQRHKQWPGRTCWAWNAKPELHFYIASSNAGFRQKNEALSSCSVSFPKEITKLYTPISPSQISLSAGLVFPTTHLDVLVLPMSFLRFGKWDHLSVYLPRT